MVDIREWDAIGLWSGCSVGIAFILVEFSSMESKILIEATIEYGMEDFNFLDFFFSSI